jgi:hypothetical protein
MGDVWHVWFSSSHQKRLLEQGQGIAIYLGADGEEVAVTNASANPDSPYNWPDKEYRGTASGYIRTDYRRPEPCD